MAQAFTPGITQAGRQLLAKAAAGGGMKFTKAWLGTGRLPESQPLDSLAALLQPAQPAKITAGSAPQAGEVLIGVQYSNEQLAEGFLLNEIGIFACETTGGTEQNEVLYCYLTFGQQPEWIGPAAAGLVTREYDIPVVVDNALQVEVAVDLSSLLSRRDWQRLLEGSQPVGKAQEADRLNGKTAADFLPVEATAKNADKLGGKLPEAYLAAGDKAVSAKDADKLGGQLPAFYAKKTEVDAARTAAGNAAATANAAVPAAHFKFTEKPGCPYYFWGVDDYGQYFCYLSSNLNVNSAAKWGTRQYFHQLQNPMAHLLTIENGDVYPTAASNFMRSSGGTFSGTAFASTSNDTAKRIRNGVVSTAANWATTISTDSILYVRG